MGLAYLLPTTMADDKGHMTFKPELVSRVFQHQDEAKIRGVTRLLVCWPCALAVRSLVMSVGRRHRMHTTWATNAPLFFFQPPFTSRYALQSTKMP